MKRQAFANKFRLKNNINKPEKEVIISSETEEKEESTVIEEPQLMMTGLTVERSEPKLSNSLFQISTMKESGTDYAKLTRAA